MCNCIFQALAAIPLFGLVAIQLCEQMKIQHSFIPQSCMVVTQVPGELKMDSLHK